MIEVKAVQIIPECEGLRLKPYVDDKGKITIGYGHNLTDNGITKEQADTMLEDDIWIARNEVNKSFPWSAKLNFPSEIHGVLIHLCFWIGINKLKEFKKMLSAMEQKDWVKAADELKDSRLYREYTTRCNKLIKIIKEEGSR